MPALPTLIPILIMAATIGAGLGIGALFFLKQSGEQRANRLYGTLLLLGGLTQLHFALDFGGYLITHPTLRYLPIYFSLWLPVLLFSHVKISLFPAYRFRWTDLKHLSLPIGQTIYFLVIWLVPSLRNEEGRYFYNPFYGGLEQALFLAGWPLYVFFSALYLRRKRAMLGARSLPRLLWYLRKLLKGVLLFILAYAILSGADFLAYKYHLADLRSQPWYAGAQALSFTVLLLWLCVYGVQVLVWGRRLKLGARELET
ncbi:MAG: hypothetical protein AB8H12_08130 [Lewinella sp.]